MDKIEHSLIIVPGLGDGKRWIEFIVRNWKEKYGIHPIVNLFNWSDSSETLDDKLSKLSKVIDEELSQGKKVSLIGLSAGGSAVLNIFSKRSQEVHKVINICGRLSEGKNVYPSLENAGKGKPAFIESVRFLEKNIKNISPEERKKILTISPLFDETVPISTMQVRNAKNIRIYSITHVISIAFCLLLPKKIIQHLK